MIARAHPDGAIDLSVGTPVDATPTLIQRALHDGANAPGYPLTAGTIELRTAIENWARRELGASGEIYLSFGGTMYSKSNMRTRFRRIT